MKAIIVSFCSLSLLLLSCQSGGRQSKRFNDLIDKEDVFIGLADYGLDSVPPDITKLKNAKRILIGPDSTNGKPVHWALPLTQIDTVFPPYHHLPDEITQLINLKQLILFDLGLRTLPENFGALRNLDSLSLTRNKLTLTAELDKLLKLKNLKYLDVTGNIVKRSDIKVLRKNNPGLIIVNLTPETQK